MMLYLASVHAERAHIGRTYMCVCMHACCCGTWWGGLLYFLSNLMAFLLLSFVRHCFPRAYRLKCSIVFVTWHLALSVVGAR